MRTLLCLFLVALSVVAWRAGIAHGQTKIEKNAIVLTNQKCLRMCRERGYAGSEERCRHLCRPGCRNAATGERFCVK
jgi:hypothetical protein